MEIPEHILTSIVLKLDKIKKEIADGENQKAISNIDILLEKPVSNSMKNMKKLLGLSKSKKIKILVGYN